MRDRRGDERAAEQQQAAAGQVPGDDRPDDAQDQHAAGAERPALRRVLRGLAIPALRPRRPAPTGGRSPRSLARTRSAGRRRATRPRPRSPGAAPAHEGFRRAQWARGCCAATRGSVWSGSSTSMVVRAALDRLPEPQLAASRQVHHGRGQGVPGDAAVQHDRRGGRRQAGRRRGHEHRRVVEVLRVACRTGASSSRPSRRRPSSASGARTGRSRHPPGGRAGAGWRARRSSRRRSAPVPRPGRRSMSQARRSGSMSSW